MKKIYLQFGLLFLTLTCFAGPATISPYLHIDQFGYRLMAQKVCIISDPQVGFNAAESFSPGATYQLKRWSDDAMVFSASITAWNGGATQVPLLTPLTRNQPLRKITSPEEKLI